MKSESYRRIGVAAIAVGLSLGIFLAPFGAELPPAGAFPMVAVSGTAIVEMPDAMGDIPILMVWRAVLQPLYAEVEQYDRLPAESSLLVVLWHMGPGQGLRGHITERA